METYEGQANVLEANVVARADGSPITAGTINFYLIAKDGTNAGKWFDGAAWQSSETALSGTPAHKADGHWFLSVASDAWSSETAYTFYWKESGDLHIPCSVDIVCVNIGGGVPSLGD